MNVDYIKAFNAKGAHNFKAGVGYQKTFNEVDNTYPGGGYVFVWWDRAFTSSVTNTTDRGPYGYYEVNDFGTRGEAESSIWSLYVQDQWQLQNVTLNLGLRTEREVDPVVPHRHRRRGLQVQLRRQDRAAPRRELGREGRWPDEGLRQLGPLLRLDEVRSQPRRLRRRHLEGVLPVARLDRRVLAVGNEHAGAEPLVVRDRQLPRSPRAELRLGRSRTSSR